MGIGKRLSTSTADLASALPASEVERNGDEKAVLVRTAPGQLLAIHSGMSALQNEVQVLQERLKKFDGALVTRQIDPTSIRPSRWANRHEASFATPAFESLKASIALAGGNAQPILVREHLPDQFEIVFGHRRHRACLELGIPVLAVVSEQSLGDIEVFLSMEQENRERADLSRSKRAGATFRRWNRDSSHHNAGSPKPWVSATPGCASPCWWRSCQRRSFRRSGRHWKFNPSTRK
jgi:ParB family chromosome partitioning protein